MYYIVSYYIILYYIILYYIILYYIILYYIILYFILFYYKIVLQYYNIIYYGSPSYIHSVVNRNVIIRPMTVLVAIFHTTLRHISLSPLCPSTELQQLQTAQYISV